MKRIYFDYAATTPVDPEVFRAMKPYFSDEFGNAGSLHYFGQKAMKALDESREKIAKAIGADFREIIFTGSATEANNLALRGVTKGVKIEKPRIIVSAIEHESVLETARDLEKNGVEVIYLPVDKNGLVNLKKLKESLNERTVLVSVMYANNEIGTIQPIFAIAEIIKKFKIQNAESRKKNSEFLIRNSKLTMDYPLFHADAVQAFQFLNCVPSGHLPQGDNINELGVDLMTLSSHKIYGPKGVGALYIRSKKQELRIKNEKSAKNSVIHNSKFMIPILAGGGQEFGLRSGTENISSIVGFAKAVELAVKNREKETKRISDLRDYFLKELKKINPKIKLNGYDAFLEESNKKTIKYLPNIMSVYFPPRAGRFASPAGGSASAEDLLVKFDLAGVAVSAGSACSARSLEPSYVLRACGLPLNIIKSTLRISLGKFTTKTELEEVVRRIKVVFRN